MGIYRCPADPAKASDGKTPRVRGYSLDAWLGQPQTGEFGPWGLKKAGELRRTSTIYGFVCENEGSIDDGLMAIYPPGTPVANQWLNLPSNRHSSGGVFSFVDGHVEFWRWHGAMVFIGRPQNATPAELPDIQRMAACVPDPLY